MSDRETCNWTGVSGKTYKYYVYQLPASFDPNQDGNYIYTKINNNNKWVPIYIGEGDLDVRVGPNHHQASCINSKGATHVHVHLNSAKQDRLSEEQDLLANYTNAYKPNGCNERTGG